MCWFQSHPSFWQIIIVIKNYHELQIWKWNGITISNDFHMIKIYVHINMIEVFPWIMSVVIMYVLMSSLWGMIITKISTDWQSWLFVHEMIIKRYYLIIYWLVHCYRRSALLCIYVNWQNLSESKNVTFSI